MKKLYTLIALLLIINLASAQNYYNSRRNMRQVSNVSYVTNYSALQLTLTMVDNYYITIGGAQYSFTGNQFFIENMNPGMAQITITKAAWGNNNNNRQTVYNGLVNFETNTRIFASIDAYGIFRVTGKEMMQQQQQVVNPNPVNPYPNNQYQPTYVTQAQLDVLLNQLKSTAFDDTKVKTAKVALKSGNYSAAQVTQIVKTITFDDNKLELAKYAYDYCYDKANFYQVSSAFAFNSSKEALQDYILSH